MPANCVTVANINATMTNVANKFAACHCSSTPNPPLVAVASGDCAADAKVKVDNWLLALSNESIKTWTDKCIMYNGTPDCGTKPDCGLGSIMAWYNCKITQYGCFGCCETCLLCPEGSGSTSATLVIEHVNTIIDGSWVLNLLGCGPSCYGCIDFACWYVAEQCGSQEEACGGDCLTDGYDCNKLYVIVEHEGGGGGQRIVVIAGLGNCGSSSSYGEWATCFGNRGCNSGYDHLCFCGCNNCVVPAGCTILAPFSDRYTGEFGEHDFVGNWYPWSVYSFAGIGSNYEPPTWNWSWSLTTCFGTIETHSEESCCEGGRHWYYAYQSSEQECLDALAAEPSKTGPCKDTPLVWPWCRTGADACYYPTGRCVYAGGGLWWRIYDLIEDGDAACYGYPTGACCDDVGGCQKVTEAYCNYIGGQYMGDDSACCPNSCVTGACCMGAYQCEAMTEWGCLGVGGTWYGDHTCQDPDWFCPNFGLGACCYNYEGTWYCSIMTETDCNNFFEESVFTLDRLCSEVDCPPVL